MGKRKERLSEGKRNIIADLIKEYDIHTADDIQDALKDLWSYVNILDTKSQIFLCCTSS